ncbi:MULTISPECIES: cytochrome c [unclassified Bradyrhizobium]|uniref:c-type cytochrome n=1 Tax=unclassified Bradyrhizobium TaxID=2631580 RepID=UPI00247A9EDE|nr:MULTISPECIES: cytochrome c [unclassified Bradyrhizobium]WGS22911.1 cytochrome c [Bradyrhizobium sp. ISRA463]WGS29909.1 cytochrome c [Bradyrhizobium sp. ISRA464]
MFRTGTVAGTLLLGVGVVAAAEDHVTLTQLAMKSNLKNAVVLYDITKGKAAYDQNAVDTALVGLEDVAKRFPSFFPESIKGKKPKGDYYASMKVWTQRADFEAHAATFAKAVGEAKTKVKDLDSLKTEFAAINDACLRCHETYRVKAR